jgi:hypothetical protein
MRLLFAIFLCIVLRGLLGIIWAVTICRQCVVARYLQSSARSIAFYLLASE